MYWPNGIPRVYAVNSPGAPIVALSEDGAKEEDALEVQDGPASDAGKDPVDEASQAVQSRQWANEPISGLCVSRSGHIFATMTEASIAIWQTRPTAVVAAVARSSSSLKTYGANVAIHFHPDSSILVAQTLAGYLLTYTITPHQNFGVYQHRFDHSIQSRRQQSVRLSSDDTEGIQSVSIRFRMAIKIESGIVQALALDSELIVATVKPAAIQCIRWTADSNGTQTSSELLSRILGVSKKISVAEMVYDRAMSLMIWTTSEGQVYALQRVSEECSDPEATKKLFRGHCFHNPTDDGGKAVKVAINARFSLLTVSCANGDIFVYNAKDYLGNVPLSDKLHPPASSVATGKLNFISYSPDGYCLFAGYEHGWTMWSVFGKPGGSSFAADRSLATENGEDWLTGVFNGSWIGGGSDIILTRRDDRRLWILETARSALTGCYSSANMARGLLQAGTEVILYRGHDLPDLMSISGKDSLWHHAQYPSNYLQSQWPIRSCVVSQDGRYIAIAGRRGLAHYSVHSGRWKVFEDAKAENSFAVRGGMCWYGHILIAAIESDGSYELRLYSRESALTNHAIMHLEYLPSPVVFIGPSGEDSLLVYTYDNILYHYIINSMQPRITLVPVGQIAFHGIVRAPARVRAISWILPEDQLRNGDPSQDVKVASVLLLVDGNLVLLQPSVSESGELKYDMRIISHDVEYYNLMRDQLSFNFSPPLEESLPPSPSPEVALSTYHRNNQSLRDSLWIFSRKELLAWSDVQDVLHQGEMSKPLPVPLDFYPLSVLLNKGIVLGVESEMIQRRDVTFTLLKYAIRTHLFLPYFLQHILFNRGTPAALSLCQQYSHLSYHAHALEILLYYVLDEEVDMESKLHKRSEPYPEHTSLLPCVVAFLQASLPTTVYLDIVVQCTRKTELRSWLTLFRYLPPPIDLFEQALRLNSLKTAAGYLLVLQALDDDEAGHEAKVEEHVVRLLSLAAQKGEWELCAELARFLMALDGSGDMLRQVIERTGLKNGPTQQRIFPNHSGTGMKGLGLQLSDRSPSLSPTSSRSPQRRPGVGQSASHGASSASSNKENGAILDNGID